MDAMNLNFECTHNQVEGTMTCNWRNGRVQLVEHFALAKTYVLIDGKEKCRHDDLTVEEFINMQRECQRVADRLTEGGAL